MTTDLLRNLILAALLTSLTGCAGSAAARRSALILQAQVGTYKSQIDDKIRQQRDFYDARAKSIQAERSRSRPLSLDQLREERSLETAVEMASDPNGNARMTVLVEHLIKTNDAEYAMQVELYKRQLSSRAELEAMIQDLTRKRTALEKVETNLATLSSGKSSAGWSRAVLTEAAEALKQLQPKQ